jgi:ribosomal protein L37AE/L43A
MGLFDTKLEPGHDALKPCPNCGEDKVGRRSNSDYYCDECGHEPTKAEINKSLFEMLKEGVKEARQNDEEADEIADPDLRQQVEDRKAEGWEIEEITHSGKRVMMTTTEGGTIGGHALTGFLTGLWSFGAGNIVYNKLSKKKNKERIALRADEVADESTQSRENIDPTELIRELKELHDEGIITEEEFKEKKHELLDEV